MALPICVLCVLTNVRHVPSWLSRQRESHDSSCHCVLVLKTTAAAQCDVLIARDRQSFGICSLLWYMRITMLSWSYGVESSRSRRRWAHRNMFVHITLPFKISNNRQAPPSCSDSPNNTCRSYTPITRAINSSSVISWLKSPLDNLTKMFESLNINKTDHWSKWISGLKTLVISSPTVMQNTSYTFYSSSSRLGPGFNDRFRLGRKFYAIFLWFLKENIYTDILFI